MEKNKVDENFKVFLYVTARKPFLWSYWDEKNFRFCYSFDGSDKSNDKLANGRVCAVLEFLHATDYMTADEKTKDRIEKYSCVSRQKIEKYCEKDKRLLALDFGRFTLLEPKKELYEFYNVKKAPINEVIGLERAPVSWQYAYTDFHRDYPCLIRCAVMSIRPEWFLLMANHEKVIELRHTLPKEIKVG